MDAARGRAAGGGDEVGTGADCQCPQRGAFSLVGGELVRVVLVYTWYTWCMAGLTEFRLSYVSRVFAKVRFSKYTSLKIVPKAAFAVHFFKKGKNVLYRR